MSRLVAVIALLVLSNCHSADPAGEQVILLTGHRGGVTGGLYPENSLAALAEAMKRNYDRVEVDVRQSRDGKLFLYHDHTFMKGYGVDRRGEDMLWEEIQSLGNNGTASPVSLEDYCLQCKGKIRLMVDIKEDQPSPEFYRELERILDAGDLLASAFFIGHGGYFKGKARITMLASEVEEFYQRWGDRIADDYFLFDLGNRINSRTIKWCQKKGIPILIAVNKFHYTDEDHMEGAARDIRWLLECGVTGFQIDSEYDIFLIR